MKRAHHLANVHSALQFLENLQRPRASACLLLRVKYRAPIIANVGPPGGPILLAAITADGGPYFYYCQYFCTIKSKLNPTYNIHNFRHAWLLNWTV